MRSTNLLAPFAAVALTAAAGAAFARDIHTRGDNAGFLQAQREASAGDRIIVHGGWLKDIEVTKDGITLVGRRAGLEGDIVVTGDGVTITGFVVDRDWSWLGRASCRSGTVVTRPPEADIQVTGDDFVFTRNRFQGPPMLHVTGCARPRIELNQLGMGAVFLTETVGGVVRANRGFAPGQVSCHDAESTVVEDNRFGSVWIIRGSAAVRSNRLSGVYVETDDATIEGNSATRIEGRGQRLRFVANDVAGGLRVRGSGAFLESNIVDGGIDVTGDAASISSNVVESPGFGVAVHGNGAEIRGNRLTVGVVGRSAGPDYEFAMRYRETPAILVVATEPGGAVESNSVTHTLGTGIDIDASGLSVTGNEIRGIEPMNSLTVQGTGNTIERNSIEHSRTESAPGNGIQVSGVENTVRGNRVVSAAVDAIAIGEGAGNRVEANVIDRAAGCGIAIAAEAATTTVADCTISRCGLGVVNHASDSSLTDTELSDNRFADVLDLGAFSLFEGNVFTTLSRDAFLSPHQ